MPKLILGLTGQIGSGKGALGEYLQKTYGAELFKFSTYLTRVLNVLALDPSRENLIRASEILRNGFGEHALSHAIARDVCASTAQIAVVDGIRRIEDLADLEPIPHFRLASVEADQRLRFERVGNRGEKTEEKGLTWETFLAQEERSTEITVPQTMARATIRIDNNGSAADLIARADALMAEFGIQKRS